MKSEDLVKQLAVLLPRYTDQFTNNSPVASLTRTGTTVLAVTVGPHGLATGRQANIIGAQTALTVASLTRVGEVGTMVTDNNHDFTEGFSTVVELVDSVEPEFNGTFQILTVPNRKTVTFTMVDAGPLVATGSPLVLNGSSALQQYNGLQEITSVPGADSFTYEITDSTLYSPAFGTISAKTNPRISAASNNETLIDAYTRQNDGDLWAFVVLGDVSASKSRKIDSDATSNLQRSNEYRQQVVFPFSVMVFFPTVDEILARKARDDAEDLFRPLCQSLLGSKIDSGLFAGAQNPINFVSHGFFGYNKAFYIHQYNFETVADITFDDTIGYDIDVAFRDIDLEMILDLGTENDPLTAEINLDDEPI